MQADGYLYLPQLLNSERVWQVRHEICDRLSAEGALDDQHSAIAAICKPEVAMHFRPDLVLASPTLHALLYTAEMICFYRNFLGGEVRHFDYTWFRAVAPGFGTPPHCDSVYMNRGTLNLYTSWTPIGDVSLDLGGLLILENSHHIDAITTNYARKDVDTYCIDRQNQKPWSGALTQNPVSLQRRYGGRWLTSEFQAGDVVIFGMFTIHASLDNHARSIRLSADSRYQLASEPTDPRWVGKHPIGHTIAAKQGRIC